MRSALNGKKVAILAADGFEEAELTEPRRALDEEGAMTVLLSPNPSQVTDWHSAGPGKPHNVDVPLQRAEPGDYDALLLPGGLKNPDALRANPKAVEFVTHFVMARKPIGVISHGAWTLIETGLLRGRKMTSCHSIKTDLENAGVLWSNEEVVIDDALVSCRQPADLPAFLTKFLKELSVQPTAAAPRAANQ